MISKTNVGAQRKFLMKIWRILLISLMAAVLSMFSAGCLFGVDSEEGDDDIVDDDADDDVDDDTDDDTDDDDDTVRFGWVVGYPDGDSATIMSTDDGGDTWTLKAAGAPPVMMGDVSAVDEDTA